MKSFTTFVTELRSITEEVIQEDIDHTNHPFHDTLTAHGYKPVKTGALRDWLTPTKHVYKRKGSSRVIVASKDGRHSWKHKEDYGLSSSKLNNLLNAHNGTGEYIDHVIQREIARRQKAGITEEMTK
jgi:hypothetical protein